jgi:hypothetical protein
LVHLTVLAASTVRARREAGLAVAIKSIAARARFDWAKDRFDAFLAFFGLFWTLSGSFCGSLACRFNRNCAGCHGRRLFRPFVDGLNA